MDSSTVYIKTAKGAEEIASRSHGLSSRVRAMLIIVDGRRNATVLLAQNPERGEAESHLAVLLDGGFIAAVSQPAAAEPPPAAAFQPASAPPADLATLKQYISSTLHDVLGPDADIFTVKVESAKNLPELRTLSEKLVEVIRNAGGKKKAEEFRDSVSSMLS